MTPDETHATLARLDILERKVDALMDVLSRAPEYGISGSWFAWVNSLKAAIHRAKNPGGLW